MDAFEIFDKANLEGKRVMFTTAAEGFEKSYEALVAKDERIATLEAELRDFRAAVIADQATDNKRIADLEADLMQAEQAANISANAANASLVMANEQAGKVRILREALRIISVAYGSESAKEALEATK